jgi:hypothetical protein
LAYDSIQKMGTVCFSKCPSTSTALNCVTPQKIVLFNSRHVRILLVSQPIFSEGLRARTRTYTQFFQQERKYSNAKRKKGDINLKLITLVSQKLVSQNFVTYSLCRKMRQIIVGVEVFTAVVMKNIIFWDMTPCSTLSCTRRFGGTYRLHLQGGRNRFS